MIYKAGWNYKPHDGESAAAKQIELNGFYIWVVYLGFIFGLYIWVVYFVYFGRFLFRDVFGVDFLNSNEIFSLGVSLIFA